MTIRSVRLGDVADFVMGQAPPGNTVNAIGDGVPFYRSGEFGSRRPHLLAWTTKPLRMSSADAVWVCVVGNNAGDLNLGAQGAIGRSVAAVVPGEAVDYLYLYYFLRSREAWLRSQAAGSAQPVLSSADLASIEISLPTLAEQRAIAATLGAFDDKIESNRRLIDLIPRLISAHVARATARESELIPISRLATFVNGGAYTKGATGTGRMVLRIAELNKGPGSSTVYNDIEVPEEKLARSGDILMSWSGSLGVYRWARDEAIVNQHIFKVIPRDFPDWLVFDRLKEVMPVFKGHAADKATTMGHIQRGHLDSTNVAIPTATDRIELDQALDPLWQRLLLAEREVLELEQLRDALLPELLSGSIRLGEVTA